MKIKFKSFALAVSCLLFACISANGTKSESIASKQVIEDLHIVAGEKQSPENCLANVFPTLTFSGHSVLIHNLSNPTCHLETIEHRQNVIKLLTEQPELLEKIEKILMKIRECERSFYNFFQTSSITQDFYFSELLNKISPSLRNALNKSTIAMELLRAWQNLDSCLSFIPGSPLEDTVTNAYIGLLDSKRSNRKVWDILYEAPYNGFKNCIMKTINEHRLGTTKDLENIATDPKYADIRHAPALAMIRHDLTLQDKYNLLSSAFPSYVAAGLVYGLRLFSDARIALRMYKSAKYIQASNKATDLLHKTMNDIAKIVECLFSLDTLIEENDKLRDNFDAYEILNLFCNKPGHISSDLKKLIRLLITDTFSGESTSLSLRGKVFAAAALMQQEFANFAPALQVAGQLDAFIAVAKNINKNKDTKAKYCFAEFENTQNPNIEISDGWHPLINKDSAVPVDIKLGDRNKVPNMLLTGPHGCGKSTGMEMIAYNVYLAHVYGIGFASSLKLSTFTKILTYIDVRQDRVNGISTFMAEARHAKQIENAITSLKSTDRCLTIIDEVFKGTMEAEASKRLYEFAKKVIQVPNNISIFATHFERPTSLENETDGKIVNFYVGLDEPQHGNFIPTYSLNRGDNKWWFEDKDKRERYIDWLIAKSA